MPRRDGEVFLFGTAMTTPETAQNTRKLGLEPGL
jgi:hypothetical protein